MPMPAQNKSRSRQDFETPDEFIAAAEQFLGLKFSYDLAADDGNYVCKPFYTIEQNALIQDWTAALDGGWGWLNPPFGQIRPWVEKAQVEGLKGANIAMLVPAAVGSNWWRDCVHEKATVFLLNGRISFDGENPYPKDCCLLIYPPLSSMPKYNVLKWKDYA